MVRNLFLSGLIVVMGVLLMGAAPPSEADSPLSEETQAKLEGLPQDAQSALLEALEDVPEEDQDGLASALADHLAALDTSLNRCYSSAHLWRSTRSNRVYGSSTISCKQVPSWIDAYVKLTSPSGVIKKNSRWKSGVKLVTVVTYLPYEFGNWTAKSYGFVGGAAAPPNSTVSKRF